MQVNIKARFILLVSLVLILHSCIKLAPSPYPDYPIGNWVKRSYLSNGLPRSGASSWVIGDTGYLVGGYNSQNDSCLSDLWQYDPVLNTWSQRAFFPGKPRQSGVGFSIGSNGYLSTGYDSAHNLLFQDCWQYNTTNNSWTRMADLPDINGLGTGARYGAVGFAINNYGYLGTGFNGNWLNDFWQFDPVNNQWKAIQNSPVSKRSGALAFVYMNEAYICTGINNGIQSTDFWKYNPTSDTWTRLRDIANTSPNSYDDDYTDIIRDHGIVLIEPAYPGGVWRAYICLGKTNGALYNKTWEYDFINDIWIRKTPFERYPRQGAISWSFINLKRGFTGLGTDGVYIFDGIEEWLPGITLDTND
jgi:hypothetical protein